MKKKPKISIIILNYNRCEYLDRSIRSCMSQEIMDKDIEILIVDDGSSDNSISMINYFKDNYLCDIKIFKLKKNMGPGYCSNLAVKKSKGDYIIRVDSDDYISKLAIEVMSNILIHNDNIAYVYGDLIRIDEAGRVLNLVKLDNKKKVYNHGAGIMFKKASVLNVGNYNKSLKVAEDYDLIKKIDKKNLKSFYIPVPFYRYYIHQKNISHKFDRKKIIRKINRGEKWN